MQRRFAISTRLSRVFLTLAIALFVTSEALAAPDRWRLEGWSRTDFSKSAIDFASILSGGPPKDGIPSIDEPKFVAIGGDVALAATEPVIALEIAGDARAYPLSVLTWHEIVNDTVGGKPVTVTYCPLCNSAVVFEREFAGKLHDFGTTGKLRNSDLVMYDRQTESWWQQFTGEAIVGSYVGRTLKMVPSRLESFERFKARFPDGKVLVPNRPGLRNYGRNPYVAYDTTGPFLYRGEMPDGIEPMARVVVFQTDSGPTAISLALLRDRERLEVGNIELRWIAGQNSALDTAEIAKGRDVGNVLVQRRSGDGLNDIPYDVTFAFVFHAFHPDRPIRLSSAANPR